MVGAAPPYGSLATMDVLIVDDDADIRTVIQSTLDAEGYETACAENGQEALTILRASEVGPRLVLLDLMMPKMNGLQLLDVLSRDVRLQAIPVVVMTAHTQHRGELAWATHAPSMFLEKPIALAELLSVVEQYCPNVERRA
jgi:CheY-like chemotaxis protein